MRRGVIPTSSSSSSSVVDFVKLDVDGDPMEIAEALRRWKGGSKERGDGGGGGRGTTTKTTGGDERHLVIHTAGPFQGRRSPNLLSSCIDITSTGSGEGGGMEMEMEMEEMEGAWKSSPWITPSSPLVPATPDRP